LTSFKVKDGDVVSVFFTATDNRQPRPQEVRSNVFFITVRSEKKKRGQRQRRGHRRKLISAE